MEILGRRYDTGQRVRLECSGGRIARCSALQVGPGEGAGDAAWPWIAPGLLDIQVNGYRGHEFASGRLTQETVLDVLRAFEAFGVTRICPTLTTESREVHEHAMRTIAATCEASSQWARRLPAIHLEGPYITPDDGARGAHPKIHCRPPDWEEFQRFQEAAGGRIRILTMSPEYDGSPEFIRRVAATGVVVALGHTSATPDQIRAAVDAGAKLSTHLGNGSHPTLHRFRNYLWPQLADDRLAASLIVDGHHLSPEMVRVFVRAKTPARCILVSDVSGQAGQAPGRYTSPFCDVEILPSGALMVAGQRELFAGASLPVSVGIANMTRFAGVDLRTAVAMATLHPAKLLGIEPGGLEAGDPADLVQFSLSGEADASRPIEFRTCCTIVDGDVAWGRPWRPN
jgi:N-acetylglucosamine-6-phosphate deacetylase